MAWRQPAHLSVSKHKPAQPRNCTPHCPPEKKNQQVPYTIVHKGRMRLLLRSYRFRCFYEGMLQSHPCSKLHGTVFRSAVKHLSASHIRPFARLVQMSPYSFVNFISGSAYNERAWFTSKDACAMGATAMGSHQWRVRWDFARSVALRG